MNKILFSFLVSFCCLTSCEETTTPIVETDIKGYNLLNDINGHWIGSNQTSFGFLDWFAFDFRPISASHTHSIYEGGTNQNIINSFFIADFEGKQQIMARNGGWLGPQYRATYYVLDSTSTTNATKYYRLVDAVGGIKRSYMELRFENDSLYFDAFKDDSGELDDPVHHMGFKGANLNPSFAQTAANVFNFPQTVSEVNLNNQFTNLIDDDSALFLEEANDPFPKSEHGHISDLTINITRGSSIENRNLLLYLSSEPVVKEDGTVDFDNLNTKVTRTITVQGEESAYTLTYLHPDTHYLTLFSDIDNNFYPSTGDVSSVSQAFEVTPNAFLTTAVTVDLEIP